jgi:type I restriction enzyme M protein
MLSARELSRVYRETHNIMRNVDGLQPQEAFDELLKYLFFKQHYESSQNSVSSLAVEDVKILFASYLGKSNSWSSEIWREKEFYLSNECLSDIHKLLFPISFSLIGYDVRSHAIREFLTPDIRKGLGIFLTPDEVVSAIVEFVAPTEKSAVLDPACGSGTFLIEYLNQQRKKSKITVYGIDKNPRMLLLADLNIGHLSKVKFDKKLADSIKDFNFDKKFDFILTNPPFGLSIDARDYDFSTLKTCKDVNGYMLKKQTSEIVFIERSFQELKPGGTLAIVIPRSIATNSSLSTARKALGEYGYIFGVMDLPPETFASTGTQTTTLVIFARKYKQIGESKESTSVAIAKIRNVGFDATGRQREGSELPYFAKYMSISLQSRMEHKFVSLIELPSKAKSFELLEDFFVTRNTEGGLKLSEVCEFVGTGRTPARKNYAEEGNFLVKVGNLSGAGIKWEARDRNFITDSEVLKRKNSKKPLLLKWGDILLTSSAHSPVYIAKKSDIYTGAPKFIGSKHISFVGEVMLVRPKLKRISPYLLLAFFRSKDTVNQIQNMVRGQTAHLHSADLSQLVIPDEVFEENSKYKIVANILEKQAELSEEMNLLISEQIRILDSNSPEIL